jgi:hypothetical protein
MKSLSRWQKLITHPRWLKTFRWEYWPIWLANIPTVLFYLYFALRARHLFFFTAVNPTIETGGVFGESKINILRQLPGQWLPKTLFIPANQIWEDTAAAIRQQGFDFPLIAKPNVGERGLLVTKVSSEPELQQLLQQFPIDFLLQSFVTLPEEASILYYRPPGKRQGVITSICIKENLRVVGDGVSPIEALMEQHGRARLQLQRFRVSFPELLAQVPEKGAQVLLEPIGNHSRGTKFLNGNHLITPEMTAFFDQLHDRMPGMHYGRFDLKCGDPGAIGRSKEVRILEYNGIAAEPAHIYDPAIPILEKYRTIFRHWQIIYSLYRQQRSQGVRPANGRTIRQHWKVYREYLKKVRQYESMTLP